MGGDWLSGKVQEPVRLESGEEENKGHQRNTGELKRDAGRAERQKQGRNEEHRRKTSRLGTSGEVK